MNLLRSRVRRRTEEDTETSMGPESEATPIPGAEVAPSETDAPSEPVVVVSLEDKAAGTDAQAAADQPEPVGASPAIGDAGPHRGRAARRAGPAPAAGWLRRAGRQRPGGVGGRRPGLDRRLSSRRAEP